LSTVFCSYFPTRILCTFVISACVLLAHRILLDFIILVMFTKGYKLRSSSLCSFLHLLSVSFRSKNSARHPVLEYFLSVLFP
jgi:hypothetical protein